jgi:hypothetical protein
MVDVNRYDRQRSKALQDGLQPCGHCGRGIAQGKGWTTYACLTSLIHFAHPSTDPSLLPVGKWEVILLGSECGTHLPVAYRQKLN